jgi:hypothetical protein
MATAIPSPCRIVGCTEIVLPALGSEKLCLSHFLDRTLVRAQNALTLCQHEQPLDPDTLDWLFEDAHFTVQWLSRRVTAEEPGQRDKVLEVMLCLANINDYLRHHSVHLTPTA